MELWSLTSVHCLIMLNICTKFKENISKGFRVIVRMRFANEQNSVKTVGNVMMLVLSELSDNALYLYQVLPKYFKGFQSYGSEQ